MDTTDSQEFKVHPLTLRFQGNVEDAFLEDYFQKSLNQTRFSLGLAMILYSLFGILDYLLIPDAKEQVWFIRYVIVFPFLVFSLLFTWSRHFKKYMQYSLVLIAGVVGLGIIAMTVVAYPPGSYYYYAGLILVLMWLYTFVTARFIFATFAGWAIVLVYEIVALVVNQTPAHVMISNSFFFITANIIGMLSCYQIELYKRKDFWQRSLLEDERMKSESLLNELHSELVLASDIQKSLLPPPSARWQGGELVCYSKPTIEIGGDFYSYHFVKNDIFALAMGDVSGHGIPAALLMAATLSLFDTTFARSMDPCERLGYLDRELVPYTEQRHQNCAFCYIELNQGKLFIANAGGIPPVIRKGNGQILRPDINGFPLGHGLGAEIGYQGIQLDLTNDDMIVLVTDGAVEAKDHRKVIFGFERLERVIAEAPNGTPQAMLNHLVNEVNGYIDRSEPQDDFSIAIVQVKI